MHLPHNKALSDHSHTLFALADCAQLSKDFYRLLRADDNIRYKSLFENTPDQTSARSGPVLIEIGDPRSEIVRSLLEVQQKQAAVIWFWSRSAQDELLQLFQSILYARMPDGSMTLCRFYDPRCLKDFLQFFEDKNKALHEELQRIVAWAYWKDKDYTLIGAAA